MCIYNSQAVVAMVVEAVVPTAGTGVAMEAADGRATLIPATAAAAVVATVRCCPASLEYRLM